MLVVVFGTFEALAYNFKPTHAEFLSWPVHCKVVYVRTQIGAKSKYVSMVSQAEKVQAESKLGGHHVGKAGIHHHCAGTAWLGRARTEFDPEMRRRALRNANSETRYSFDRVEVDDPMYAASHVQMASVLYEQGDMVGALAILEAVIQTKPTPIAYTAKAYMHHKQGDLEKARSVLVEGDAQANGNSAEIHYNLGLILLKLSQPQLAVEHAKKAYAGGYPLPGLRNKLQRAGVWN